MEEIWRPVKGFEGRYEVSTKGRVRSLRRLVKGGHGNLQYRDGQILKPQTGSTYAQVYLRVGDKQKWFYVHRLVAQAFIPNPDDLPLINHKDENRLNNCVENLEWCTCKYNINYGTGVKRRAEKQKKRFQDMLDSLGLTREEYKKKKYYEYYAKNREKIIEYSLARYYKKKNSDYLLQNKE